MASRILRYLGVVFLIVIVGGFVFLQLDLFRALRQRWTYKLVVSHPQQTSDAFSILYQAQADNTFNSIRWFGAPIQKNPMDLMIYQEMMYELKPDVIVECGTYKGGSALFLAHLMDLIGKGRVITIDIEKFPNLPVHPRITYLLGSSTAPEIVQQVRGSIHPGETVMVLLDSDHAARHVSNELRLYHDMVTPGSYLIVEDTDFNGHPILPKFGPGPMEAAAQFLKENPNFQVDPAREKLMLTFNPQGYLRRIN